MEKYMNLAWSPTSSSMARFLVSFSGASLAKKAALRAAVAMEGACFLVSNSLMNSMGVVANTFAL